MAEEFRWTSNTLSAKLAEMRRNLADPTAPLAAIGEIMVGSSQETIRVGGRPNKFTPLALATLIARAGGASRAFTKKARRSHEYSAASLTVRAKKVMSNAAPLFFHGTMLKTISSRVVGWSVQWGTNSPQAALLNFGGMAGRGHKVHVPPRPFIQAPFPDEWRDVERILMNWAFGEEAV